MPWSASDAHGKTHKANTPKKKRQWAHVANSALKRGASEGSAVRQANAAVGHHPAKHAANKSGGRWS
jgi:hypothetical protein